jgi:hypothetical protein
MSILLSYFPSHCSSVTEICHIALPAHVLPSVQFVLDSVGKEGHFTADAQTLIRPYLHSHCSGLIQICHMAFPAHALHAVQFTLNLVSNEGRFTLEADTFFVRFSTRSVVGCFKYAMLHSLRILS